jgi:ectoine hydroxylase-related dioxygenase (phytanoyl-CoA dioxygenase family)
MGNTAHATNTHRLDVKKNIEDLRETGYTVVPGYLSTAEIREYLKLTEKHWDSRRHSEFKGRPERELDDKMVYGLQAKDKAFIDLLDQENLVQILMHYLNDPYYKHLPPETPNYILSYYNARSSGPELPLHTDTFIPSPGDRTWTVQASFFLEDSRKDNGCTVVVPQSHVSGKFVDRSKKHDLHYVEAKAGDLVMWDSRIWHGTTANVSKKSRWALIATFTCWWVKQRTDMTRSLPENIYSTLSDRQKILLGFASIPPRDEGDRLNFKGGLADLRAHVRDYHT